MPPDHPTVQQVALAQFWHTDSSYRKSPALALCCTGWRSAALAAKPSSPTCTRFTTPCRKSLKRQVRGRKARHNFGHMHTQANLKPLTEEELAAMPPVWQPMVRKHPVTGRSALYISPIYNDVVEGMNREEGKQLITELTQIAADPRSSTLTAGKPTTS